MATVWLVVEAAVAEVQSELFGPDDTSVLAAITASNAVLEAAESHLAETVSRRRSMGATWQEVGDALGTTRQGAQRRFGKNSANDTEESK